MIGAHRAAVIGLRATFRKRDGFATFALIVGAGSKEATIRTVSARTPSSVAAQPRHARSAITAFGISCAFEAQIVALRSPCASMAARSIGYSTGTWVASLIVAGATAAISLARHAVPRTASSASHARRATRTAPAVVTRARDEQCQHPHNACPLHGSSRYAAARADQSKPTTHRVTHVCSRVRTGCIRAVATKGQRPPRGGGRGRRCETGDARGVQRF